MLTSRNNPTLEKNAGDEMLYMFPDERSSAMDPHTPYIELAVGVRNILKLFGVDYVRRLNYLDKPGVKKNGIRFYLTFSF